MTASRKLVIIIGLFFVTGVAWIVFMMLTNKDVVQVNTAQVIAANNFESTVTELNLDAEFDRKTFVTDMRAAVEARGPSKIIIPGPVEDDRELIATESGSAFSSNRTVRWCDATVLDQTFLSYWPQTPVTVVKNDSFFMLIQEASVGSVGSTSIPLDRTVLAQLRVSGKPSGEPTCLLHNYIGVTPAGQLIANSDAAKFKVATENTLIGYAFDGNPIFGASTHPERLDLCGGEVVQGEYQYQIRSGEDFVLGCFVNEPAQVFPRG